MFSMSNSCFSTAYIKVISFFCVVLLAACSGSNDKKSSSSSSVSSSLSTSSSSSSSSVAVAPHLGQWYAPAYGYVLSVSADNDAFTVKTYSVTEDYCLLQNVTPSLSMDKLAHAFVYSSEIKEILLETKGDYPPGIEYEKLTQLPAVCEENLQKVKTDSEYTFDAKKDFEVFWQTFNELYVNFELRDVDWDEVYAESIHFVDDIEDEDELFELLSTLIAPLGDGHAILIRAPLGENLNESIAAALDDGAPMFSASTQLTLYEKLIGEYIQELEAQGEVVEDLTDEKIAEAEDYILTNYLQIMDIIFSYADEDSDIEIRASGEISWFKMNDNIGYLMISSMADYGEGGSTIVSDIAYDLAIAEETINEALKDLQDTDGLIIDVRTNSGGQDQIALNFVRHFISSPQVVFSKFAGSGVQATPKKDVVLDPQSDNIYLKPTALLVSGDTGSAAELFTIAMGSLPQVTIIGEPTAGAMSDVLVKRLTSDILFGISNETYLDVQGNNYEKIGIPADIAVPFGTLQERQEGYDGGVDAAINWIKGTP